MKEVYIYCLKDPINNEIRYIGKTTNLKRRMSQHIQDVKSNTHNKRRVINWINSLLNKKLKPKMEVIEICNKENWQEREIYWIAFYKNIFVLCNHHEGGLGILGRKLSETDKNRIREIGYAQSYFTEDEKKHIWELMQKGFDYKTIKNLYTKFSESSFRGIRIGGIWNHITNLPKPIRHDNKGKNNKQSKRVLYIETNKMWESASLAWKELYYDKYKLSYFRAMMAGYLKNKTTLKYIYPT